MPETRILYVGDQQPGSTSLHRRAALEELGFAIEPFDSHRYVSMGSRLSRSLLSRYAINDHVIRLMNEELSAAAAASDAAWVWIDKAVWVWPSTIRVLSKPGR